MSGMYQIPQPAFDSDLVALLFEVERMRANIGLGDTPVEIYAELHLLFDTVMSVVSARIEGNHTTVYEVLESALPDEEVSVGDHLREISNIAETARFIDSLDPEVPLTHTLVRDLHARAVRELEREGDPTPGRYREQEVRISGSVHSPPSWVTVHAEMTELLDFANRDLPLSQQMLQVAIAHHRFVWVHPFSNGNGRVSRLFTYAMLRRSVFSTRGHSALNPMSVFGNDRAEYIAALEGADRLDDEGSVQWATFFVKGIKGDLDRVVKLQDHAYVVSKIVGPALVRLVNEGVVGVETADVLKLVLEKGAVKAGDLAKVLPGSPAHRSRAIRDLIAQGLLRHAAAGPRFYQLSLARGPIASRLIRQLDDLGFLPKILSED